MFHLAAEVGGIGANRANPGRFLYANLMMGAHLLEPAACTASASSSPLGTVCAYPKFTPVPFSEDDLWNGYPEETNAPYGVAKKMLLVGAQGYREQYGTNAIFLLPVNLYGPRDNFDLETLARDPGADPQDGRGASDEVVLWGDGSPTREFLYVDDCAEGAAARRRALRRRASRSTSARARRSRSASSRSSIAELTGFEGEIVWDTSKPNGQPRRRLDVSRAKELFGFERAARGSATASRARSSGTGLGRRPRRERPRTEVVQRRSACERASTRSSGRSSGSPASGRCTCSRRSSPRNG